MTQKSALSNVVVEPWNLDVCARALWGVWGGSRQERNPINAPNSAGGTNLYAPKFDPEGTTTSRTLIIAVFFLYPEHAMSDFILGFVSRYDIWGGK